MQFVYLSFIVLGILLICVSGMAIGVILRGKPIQHCGGASVGAKGEKLGCSVCSNTECPTKREAALAETDADSLSGAEPGVDSE